MTLVCPLCQHTAKLFYDFRQRFFYQCDYCRAMIRDPATWPDREQEKKRYLEHLNDVEDPRFQRFVKPLTDSVRQSFGQGFDIEAYDPLFFNRPELLQQQYDYICSCEVIEHFHHPAQSLSLLLQLLKPSAQLFCMTELFDDSIDFHRWNYKNDPTHVFIYHRKTIAYIAEKYGFSSFSVAGRLISFSR